MDGNAADFSETDSFVSHVRDIKCSSVNETSEYIRVCAPFLFQLILPHEKYKTLR